MNFRSASVPYEVEIVPDWRQVDHDDTVKLLRGQVNHLKHNVRIAGDMPVEQQQVTLIHEALHIIVENYYIRELTNQDSEHLEPPIQQLAIGLTEFLSSADSGTLALFGLTRGPNSPKAR